MLVEAKTLFPAGSVSIRNIWDYNKNGKNGSQRVTIDEAIIYAASLAVSSDSILADPLFNMLNYKPALLKKVSNCVYESGLGVSGWIGSRRVLLGSRDHMKSHGITVPDSKKETALNKKNDEVIYLAVARRGLHAVLRYAHRESAGEAPGAEARTQRRQPCCQDR